MRDPIPFSTPVARFADALLAADLPRLPDDRRHETVAFIEARVAVLPSVTRFGVRLIASVVGVVAALGGHRRAIGLVTAVPLPLLAEYPRLIRSLGYAFVWETWPLTHTDGGMA
jgi:hypothetical protein